MNTIPSGDCASCTLYVVLFAVFLTTSVITGGVFVHFHWYSKKKNDKLNPEKNTVRVKFNPRTQTTSKSQVFLCSHVKFHLSAIF